MSEYSKFAATTRKKSRRRLLWLLPLLLVLLICLVGLIAVSPVVLVFWHTAHLPGLSVSLQQDLEFLADLKIVEPPDQSSVESPDQSDEPINIVHSLDVTMPDEAVEEILNETLDQYPGRFIRITSLTIRIVPDRILAHIDVDYILGGRIVFNTVFTSEWRLRTSPVLLAAPMPNIVELSPLTIRAAYWPTVEWTPLWQIMTRQHAKNGWLPLEFTTPFRLEDLLLEDGELVLSIAPGTFL